MISAPLIPRLGLLRVRYTPIRAEAAITRITGRFALSRFAYVILPNSRYVLAAYRGDERFAGPLRGAWLVLNDSPILCLLTALLFGERLPAVSANGLIKRLFESGCMKGETLTIIGGDTAVAAHIRRRYAPAALAQYIPPGGFHSDPTEVRACIDFVHAHPARYVFFAVGAPQSEMLASLLGKDRRSTGVGLCVGRALNLLMQGAPLGAARAQALDGTAQSFAWPRWRGVLDALPILWIALRERLERNAV